MEHPHFYRWYCQHVIPLVFDNSLSYYEVLCKLTQAMGELTKKQEEYFETLKPIIDSIENIINVAWPNFQQEINDKVESWNAQFNELETNVTNKLEEYKQNYESFTSHWDEVLSGNQTAINQMKADIAAMDAELKDRLQQQDNTISDTLQRHLGIINNAIAAQDKKIQDFIDTYNPVPVPQPMYPEAIVTTDPGATVTAVNGDKTVTAIAGSDGVATLVLKAYGTWALTSTLNNLTGDSVALNVDDVKQYRVEVAPASPPSEYHITINASVANNNPLLALFRAGTFKITDSSGVVISTLSASTNATFTLNTPGRYKFTYTTINALPHLDASSGYVLTGNTQIQPSVITRYETISNESPDVTINFTVPTISVGWKSGNPAMNITPPGSDQRKTGITAATNPYMFIPWTSGQWLFDDNYGLDKGYTVKEVDGLSFNFNLTQWNVDNTPNTNSTPLPFYNYLSNYPSATIEDLHNNANKIVNTLKIGSGACANNGKLVGYLLKKEGTGYIYEDGTDYLPTHYAGLIIPAMSYRYNFTSNTNYPGEVSSLNMRPTSTEQTGDYAFSPVHSMDNAWHDGILVSYGPYDPDNDTFTPGYKPTGERPTTAKHNVYYPNNYSLPPSCELMRIDQALFLHIIHLAFVGGNKTSRDFTTNDMTAAYISVNANTLAFSIFGFSNMNFNVVTSTNSSRTFRVPAAGGTYTWAYWNTGNVRSDDSALFDQFVNPFPRCFYPEIATTNPPRGSIKFFTGETRNSPTVRLTSIETSPPITIQNNASGNCYPVFFLDND